MGKDDRETDDGNAGVIDCELARIQRETIKVDRECEEFVRRLPAEHYPDALNDFLWATYDGHAYSKVAITEKFDQFSHYRPTFGPIPRILKCTDQLALKVGFCVFAELRHTAKEHQRLLQANIIGPATRLLKGLENTEIKRAFLMPRSKLSYEAQEATKNVLECLVCEAEEQQRFYSRLSERGKDPLSDLKYFYVAQVHKLCRGMDPSFRPTRSYSEGQREFTKFTGMVDLLHPPFKWGKTKAAKVSFEAATQSFVRNWNANLNAGRDPTQHLYGAL